MQCHVFSFPNAAVSGGLCYMAVGAQNLALCDLNKNGRPGETGRAHVGDVVALIAEVVELKDDRIPLAALDTGMLGEVLPGA